jgi:hypothetical protein
MKKHLLKIFLVGVISCVGTAQALAIPAHMVSIDGAKTESLFQDARAYCYNRATGRFKHWGACNALYRVCDWNGCRLVRRSW